MRKNKEILIFGAGAIGRGFLAPKFFEKNYSITFIDNNLNLINKLRKRKKYIAAFTEGNRYKFHKVNIKDIFHIDEKFEINKYDIVFTCVGPNQCYNIVNKFRGAKTSSLVKNDLNSKKLLKKLLELKMFILLYQM